MASLSRDQAECRAEKETSINKSINLFICFVLQNKKYTNICEKKFSKAQEGSKMTIRSSSQLPPSIQWEKKFFLSEKHSSTLTKTQYI